MSGIPSTTIIQQWPEWKLLLCKWKPEILIEQWKCANSKWTID
jgi:hypothetical protein